jgi:hypothetical protein
MLSSAAAAVALARHGWGEEPPADTQQLVGRATATPEGRS